MSARLRSGTSTCRSPRRSKSVSTARGDDYQKYEGVKGARSRLGDARRYGQNLVHRPFPRRIHLRYEYRRSEGAHLRRGRAKGTALDYTPSSGGMIQAFYYTIPNLKFGQWAELITTSTNAYGTTGKSGSSSSSTSGSSGLFVELPRLSQLPQLFANSYYGSGGFTGVLRRLTATTTAVTTTALRGLRLRQFQHGYHRDDHHHRDPVVHAPYFPALHRTGRLIRLRCPWKNRPFAIEGRFYFCSVHVTFLFHFLRQKFCSSAKLY